MERADSEHLRVVLAGSLRVVAGDGRCVESAAFPGRQGRLVFARLATALGAVSREDLAEDLWPSGPPPHWRRDLAVLVSKLRSLLRAVDLDGQEFVSVGGCYELRLPTGTWVDVDAAVAQAKAAGAALRDGDLEKALAAAIEAMEVARRPLFPGEHTAWLTNWRARLEQALVTALDVAATVHADRGEHARAVALAGEAVDVAPFRESGYVRLMRHYLAVGDRAEALRTYARCRKLLAAELGVDPAPETEAIYLEALRAGLGPLGAPRATPDPPGERVLGNLPVPVTTFVGRDGAMERVATALARTRLVTLTGVGGVGKSRLALESAARMAAAYPDGAWQCELARVSEGDVVAHALADALGLDQSAAVSIEDAVVTFLGSKRLLLVIDNCEHLLEAVAPIVDAVLRACPQVSVLATSRERLAVDGEHVLAVEPLEVPAPGTDALASLLPPAAVRLFSDRAAASRPGFRVTPANAGAVADVCRRLDGVPLAVELAAARLRILGVTELAERLDERFHLLTDGPRGGVARQQTLLAAVSWSYELLEPAERDVFDRLSTFAGSFPLHAAAAVCADLELPVPLETAITALVDRSMVVADTGDDPVRYRLLETLRAYGGDRLAERGRQRAVERRHAAHYVALAEGASERLLGPWEATGAAVLQAEMDDLRAAHRRSVRAGDVDLALRLSAALHWFAVFRTQREVARWAEEARALPGACEHRLFPQVCGSAGAGRWMRGSVAEASEVAREGLQAAGSRSSRRFPHHVLGDTAMLEGRLDSAQSHYTTALEGAREAGDAFHQTLARGCQLLVHTYGGTKPAGEDLADDVDRLAQRCGAPSAAAWSRYAVGEALLDEAPDRAIALLEEGIQLARAVGNTFVLGLCLLSASSLRTRHGAPEEAVRTFLDVIQHWQRQANWTQQWTTIRNVIDLLVRLRVDTAAAVLLGGVEASETVPAFGPDADRLTAARRTLESRLGGPAAAAAVAQGGAMTKERIVDYACKQLRELRTPSVS